MKQIINVSIDLVKISKEAIKEVTKKDGSIGKYLNLTLIMSEEKDQYQNDGSVSLSQSKEERDAKVKPIFVGNAKIVWQGTAKAISNEKNTDKDDSDLPF